MEFPPHLRTITDTNAVKRHLKSVLFSVFLIVLLALLDKLYSGTIQITDLILLYCIFVGRQ